MSQREYEQQERIYQLTESLYLGQCRELKWKMEALHQEREDWRRSINVEQLGTKGGDR